MVKVETKININELELIHKAIRSYGNSKDLSEDVREQVRELGRLIYGKIQDYKNGVKLEATDAV